jgi:Tfp pilus assembly protein PilV
MNKNINTKKENQKGIALVEVIAAVGIAVVVITSLVSLSISTLRTSLKSKLLLEGSKIANRELELVRAYRDTVPWSEFISALVNENCSSSCSISTDGLNIVSSGEVVEGTGTEALRRSFTAKTPGGAVLSVIDNTARISVSVIWTIGGEEKGAYLYTDLTNWRSE